MSQQDILKVEKVNATWVLLNKPDKRNALDIEMSNNLSQALKECSKETNTKVVVLSGEGSAFCSGGDVEAMANAKDPTEYLRRLSRAINQAILTMRNMRKPVIAAVNGHALGAGFSLMLGADLRIATSSSKFSLAFRNIGLAPGCGTYVLPRIVGYSKACELTLLGDTFDSKQAEQLGIVNKTVPNNKLVVSVNKYVNKLASGPLKALSLTKDLLNASFDTSFGKHCENEAEAIARSAGTKDAREGFKAFLEKRKPKFEGK
jgi:2-(1,2-epoxy-1,2-dihydrophenyl)acetyl-CoA isomerase